MINAGNHEVEFEEGVPPVLWLLGSRYKNVYTTSYKKPWTKHTWQGLNVYLIPYKKEALFNKVLKQLLESKIEQPACLCIHQNIKGIKMGDAVLQEGLAAQEICGLAKNKFKFIMCGHLHHSHVIDKFGIPIIIPGSTSANTFSDGSTKKSFYVLKFNDDFSIRKIKTIPIEKQVTFGTYDFALQIKGKKTAEVMSDICRIDVPVEDQQEFFEYSKMMMAKGVISVKPRWVKKQAKHDLEEDLRPIEMNMDDWLVTFLTRKGYNGEEIESAIECNEKLFGTNKVKTEN